jgi:hypothetical protein
MKYALSNDILDKMPSWTLTPWILMGAKTYDCISSIPDDEVLIVSHFAPWWNPVRSYIQEGRPYIEIDYGYWGKNSPKRQSRRVTFNGHHNLNIKSPPFSRSNLFSEPTILPWKENKGEFVLGILPIEEQLLLRTGETIPQFKDRLSKIIANYYDGPIIWRKKVGQNKFDSLQQQIKDAYAVVGERTMACVETCLLGTPAFTVDKSMTTLLMGGIENLKDIQLPDRTAWIEHLSWSQFLHEEFLTVAPAELTEQYQII